MKNKSVWAVLAALLIPSITASAAVITLVPSRDTTLFAENPDLNLGASDLIAGTTGRNGVIARSLLYFNIASSIPAGSTITDVTFRDKIIRQSQAGADSAYELHRFLKGWTEGSGTGNGSSAAPGDSTWNSQSHGSTLWSAPGGQAGVEYTAAPSAAGPVIGIPNIIYSISSTPSLVADVQNWLDDPSNNNGWFLLSSSEGSTGTARRFSSRESLASGGVLDLTVTYAVPEPSMAGVLMLSLCVLRSRKRRSCV